MKFNIEGLYPRKKHTEKKIKKHVNLQGPKDYLSLILSISTAWVGSSTYIS